MPYLRQLFNDVLSDSVYYAMPYHHVRILEIVARRLHAAHEAFMRIHPGFKGKIHLLGHSLGGIIGYDLLSGSRLVPPKRRKPTDKQQWLAFKVEHLFLIGCPLSATLTMRALRCGEYVTRLRWIRSLGASAAVQIGDGRNFMPEDAVDGEPHAIDTLATDDVEVRHLAYHVIPDTVRVHNIYNPFDPLVASMNEQHEVTLIRRTVRSPSSCLSISPRPRRC